METKRGAATILMLIILCSACANDHPPSTGPGSDGPYYSVPASANRHGDDDRGREIFRYETFGNEGFWTDAARLPAGIVAAKLTPLQALKLGLNVDLKKVPTGILLSTAGALAIDPSGESSSVLNDPAVTIALINANAVIGVVAKDTNGDGKIDVASGDKVGISCALCHTRVGFSVLREPNGAGIGRRIDGVATHSINIGAIFAAAANTKALYPLLQLQLDANHGKTIGRAATGLRADASEAEFDAFLSNPANYPVGMFDDTLDGVGNQNHNSALFRQELAAPYGSAGEIEHLDNFNNLVYTALLDPTIITTKAGRAFMHRTGGAAGDEIVANYVKILAATGVTGYPYVKAAPYFPAGGEEAPVGVRVSERRLLDLNAYLDELDAPVGKHGDRVAIARGRTLFRSSAGCTACHNVDQGQPVPAGVIAMNRIWPGDHPEVLSTRQPPLNPIMNSPGTFDDKTVVINASQRGGQRGIALPLLLDLGAKPNFLHDSSVPSLDALLDPNRGASAPHPFYIADPQARHDITAFLVSASDDD